MIYYPTELDLRGWVGFLQTRTSKLTPYLPHIDEEWYSAVLDTIEQVRLPYIKNDLNAKAANIFFKIVENHRRIDNNKRSAVVAIYLFYLLNDKVFEGGNPEIIRILAKVIAKRRYADNPECMNLVKDNDIETLTEVLAAAFCDDIT